MWIKASKICCNGLLVVSSGSKEGDVEDGDAATGVNDGEGSLLSGVDPNEADFFGLCHVRMTFLLIEGMPSMSSVSVWMITM